MEEDASQKVGGGGMRKLKEKTHGQQSKHQDPKPEEGGGDEKG